MKIHPRGRRTISFIKLILRPKRMRTFAHKYAVVDNKFADAFHSTRLDRIRPSRKQVIDRQTIMRNSRCVNIRGLREQFRIAQRRISIADDEQAISITQESSAKDKVRSKSQQRRASCEQFHVARRGHGFAAVERNDRISRRTIADADSDHRLLQAKRIDFGSNGSSDVARGRGRGLIRGLIRRGNRPRERRCHHRSKHSASQCES